MNEKQRPEPQLSKKIATVVAIAVLALGVRNCAPQPSQEPEHLDGKRIKFTQVCGPRGTRTLSAFNTTDKSLVLVVGKPVGDNPDEDNSVVITVPPYQRATPLTADKDQIAVGYEGLRVDVYSDGDPTAEPISSFLVAQEDIGQCGVPTQRPVIQ